MHATTQSPQSGAPVGSGEERRPWRDLGGLPGTRIKICCIGSVAEAHLAIARGADVLGLVSAMPSGAGIISDGRIREIAAATPPHVGTFLLTSRPTAEEIVRQHAEAPTSAIQLVDRHPPETLAALRRALPGVALVQVLHVESREVIAEARRVAPQVDYLLLDSGRPSAAVPELGGTGRTHNWAISAELVAAVDRPVFLAGGLDPSNVTAAIQQVRPFGVDVCSRLRPGGRLDDGLLEAFVAAVREADR